MSNKMSNEEIVNEEISLIPRVPRAVGKKKARNLWALACGLKRLSELGLGDIFDMGTFTSEFYEMPNRTPECGSTRCAVGWGPALGIGFDETADLLAPFIDYARDYAQAERDNPYLALQNEMHQYWHKYYTRALCKLSPHNMTWEWMFDSSWEAVDNTMLGAAQRIAYFLCVSDSKSWLCDAPEMVPYVLDEMDDIREETAVEFDWWKELFDWDVIPEIPGAAEAAARAVRRADGIRDTWDEN